MSLRLMLPFGCLLVAAASALVPAWAGTLVRASVEPDTAWVGQRVLLRVDVLSDAGWAQVSRFGELELADAYVLRTDLQGVRLQESIDGTSYSGQRYELSVYPQAPGRLEIPAIPIDVSVRSYGAGSGAGGGEQVEQTRTGATTVEVRTPPGAEGIDGLISPPKLTAEQRWESVPNDPEVGDALKRVISFEASEVSGMAFSPLTFESIPGVGVYPAEPAVQDKSDRGSLTGTRTESVSYVLEKSGQVTFPDITLDWWNTDAERLERIVLMGKTLRVAVGASETRPGVAESRGSPILSFLIAVLLLAALVALALYRFRKGFRSRWHAWKVKWQHSEASYFKRAIASIESGNRRRAIADIMRWLDRIHDGTRPERLDEFLEHFARLEERERLAASLADIDEDSQLRDTKRLASDFRRVRARWRVERRRSARVAVTGLPTLN